MGLLDYFFNTTKTNPQDEEFATGGKLSLHISEISSLTGVRPQKLSEFFQEYGINDERILEILMALGQGKLAKSDFVSAVSGQPNNEYIAEVIKRTHSGSGEYVAGGFLSKAFSKENIDKAKALATKAADKGKQQYHKAKAEVDRKVHNEKRKITIGVLAETGMRNGVTKSEENALEKAALLVDEIYAKGGQPTKDKHDVAAERFPLGEQYRLVKMVFDNPETKRQAIGELIEYRDLYSADPDTLRFGKPGSYYASEYQKAIDYINKELDAKIDTKDEVVKAFQNELLDFIMDANPKFTDPERRKYKTIIKLDFGKVLNRHWGPGYFLQTLGQKILRDPKSDVSGSNFLLSEFSSKLAEVYDAPKFKDGGDLNINNAITWYHPFYAIPSSENGSQINIVCNGNVIDAAKDLTEAKFKIKWLKIGEERGVEITNKAVFTPNHHGYFFFKYGFTSILLGKNVKRSLSAFELIKKGAECAEKKRKTLTKFSIGDKVSWIGEDGATSIGVVSDVGNTNEGQFVWVGDNQIEFKPSELHHLSLIANEVNNKETEFEDTLKVERVGDFFIYKNTKEANNGAFKSYEEGGPPFFVTQHEGVVVYKGQSRKDAVDWIEQIVFGKSMTYKDGGHPLHYQGSKVFIGFYRNRFVVVSAANPTKGQLWAKEYFKTKEDALQFIADNEFHLISDEVVKWSKATISEFDNEPLFVVPIEKFNWGGNIANDFSENEKVQKLIAEFNDGKVTAAVLWEVLSGGKPYFGHIFTGAEASYIYRTLGFHAFSGYPLLKKDGTVVYAEGGVVSPNWQNGYKEYVAEVWNSGDKSHISKIGQEKELAYYLDLQEGLSNGSIKPSKIIGTGHKSQYVRRLAEDYLKERIREVEATIASGGILQPIMQLNYKYHIRNAFASKEITEEKYLSLLGSLNSAIAEANSQFAKGGQPQASWSQGPDPIVSDFVNNSAADIAKYYTGCNESFAKQINENAGFKYIGQYKIAQASFPFSSRAVSLMVYLGYKIKDAEAEFNQSSGSYLSYVEDTTDAEPLFDVDAVFDEPSQTVMFVFGLHKFAKGGQPNDHPNPETLDFVNSHAADIVKYYTGAESGNVKQVNEESAFRYIGQYKTYAHQYGKSTDAVNLEIFLGRKYDNAVAENTQSMGNYSSYVDDLIDNNINLYDIDVRFNPVTKSVIFVFWFNTSEEQQNGTNAINPYMGKPGDKVFVRHQGKKPFDSYKLINADNFSLVDMDFSSPTKAYQYAHKQGLEIVEYSDKKGVFANGGKLGEIQIGKWLKKKSSNAFCKVYEFDKQLSKIKVADVYANPAKDWYRLEDWKIASPKKSEWNHQGFGDSISLSSDEQLIVDDYKDGKLSKSDLWQILIEGNDYKGHNYHTNKWNGKSPSRIYSKLGWDLFAQYYPSMNNDAKLEKDNILKNNEDLAHKFPKFLELVQVEESAYAKGGKLTNSHLHNLNEADIRKQLNSLSDETFANNAAYILSLDLDKTLWCVADPDKNAEGKTWRDIYTEKLVDEIMLDKRYAAEIFATGGQPSSYKERFRKFTEGLQVLTAVTGIAISGAGCVYSTSNNNVKYSNDWTSWDILPNGIKVVERPSPNFPVDRYNVFIRGLEKLSSKYGVEVSITGGVEVLQPHNNRKVIYDTDHTSGDISYTYSDTSDTFETGGSLSDKFPKFLELVMEDVNNSNSMSKERGNLQSVENIANVLGGLSADKLLEVAKAETIKGPGFEDDKEWRSSVYFFGKDCGGIHYDKVKKEYAAIPKIYGGPVKRFKTEKAASDYIFRRIKGIPIEYANIATAEVSPIKVAQHYHKAKATGNNPKLVKNIEDLLSNYPNDDKRKADVHLFRTLSYAISKLTPSKIKAQFSINLSGKDVQGIHATAMQIILRDGDKPFSEQALHDILNQAGELYMEEKHAHKYSSGGELDAEDRCYELQEQLSRELVRPKPDQGRVRALKYFLSKCN